MPLLKDNDVIEDHWIRIDGDAPLPKTGDVIVSFARLLADFGKLSKRAGRLGVEFPNAERAEVLESFLPALSLIALPFPKFADGRAYSQARVIRQLGFTGELRAVGDVLPDQLAFMREVGFDVFEITTRVAPELWQKTAQGLRLSYQPVRQDDRLHVWRARQLRT